MWKQEPLASVVPCVQPWLKVSATDGHPLAAARFSGEPWTIRIFNPAVSSVACDTYMANSSRLHTQLVEPISQVILD